MSSNFQLSNYLTQPSLNGQKWLIAIIAGVIAGILFAPVTYGLTNSISKTLHGPTLYVSTGGATGWGLLIHVIIFTLIIRLLMGFH